MRIYPVEASSQNSSMNRRFLNGRILSEGDDENNAAPVDIPRSLANSNTSMNAAGKSNSEINLFMEMEPPPAIESLSNEEINQPLTPKKQSSVDVKKEEETKTTEKTTKLDFNTTSNIIRAKSQMTRENGGKAAVMKSFHSISQTDMQALIPPPSIVEGGIQREISNLDKVVKEVTLQEKTDENATSQTQKQNMQQMKPKANENVDQKPKSIVETTTKETVPKTNLAIQSSMNGSTEYLKSDISDKSRATFQPLKRDPSDDDNLNRMRPYLSIENFESSNESISKNANAVENQSSVEMKNVVDKLKSTGNSSPNMTTSPVKVSELSPEVPNPEAKRANSVKASSNKQYSFVVYFEDIGFRTLHAIESTLIAKLEEKLLLQVYPKNAFKLEDFKMIVFYNPNTEESEVSPNETVKTIMSKCQGGDIPKFLLTRRKTQDQDKIAVALPSGEVKSFTFTVFTTVERALNIIAKEYNIPGKLSLSRKLDDYCEILDNSDTPFNPWLIDNTQFEITSTLSEPATKIEDEMRYIRIYFHDSYQSVSLDKQTRASEVITTILNSLVDASPEDTNRERYELCMIVRNKLIPLRDDEFPLLKLDQSTEAEEELILKDLQDEGRAEKSRHKEAKRMQKVAGFFGVQKSEAEVLQIRKALSQNQNRKFISKSTQDLTDIAKVQKHGLERQEEEPGLRSGGNSKSNAKVDELPKDMIKRAGKIAHFFGARNEKEVDQIRKILTVEQQLQQRNRSNTSSHVTVRVYLKDFSYKHLNVSVKTTVAEIINLLGDKVLIKENELSSYGLFECSQAGEERILGNDEIIFEILSNWHDKQIFMFRPKQEKLSRTMSQSIANLDVQSAPALEVHSSSKSLKEPKEETSSSDEKKVSKLAGFFGAEVDMMLKALNNMNTALPDLHQRTVKVDCIHKEGWLHKFDANRPEIAGNLCWCYIENRYFNIRFRDSDDDKSDTRTLVETANQQASRWCLPLHKSVIVNQVGQRKWAFQIIYNKNVAVSLSCASKAEYEDWLNALQFKHVTTTGDKLRNNRLSNRIESKPKVTISDFEVLRVLGQGQYGKVYLCSQKSTGHLYAIKVVKKSVGDPMSTVNENKILRGIQHPFIVSLHFAFQTAEKLYLVMEYVNGGELFFHLSNFGSFDIDRTRFYAAEILLALECLHGKGIVYRDLKLENILLDREGHTKITDFGLSGSVDEDGQKQCSGTVEYFAPEILLERKQTFAADWWAYGVVLFEMLCGYHPFYNPQRPILYQKILQSPIPFPEDLDPQARDLISQLLQRNPSMRLGCSNAKGSQAIREHPFFSCLDFTMLFKRKVKPPFVPEINNETDTKYFDQEFTSQTPVMTPAGSCMLDASESGSRSAINQTDDENVAMEGFTYQRGMNSLVNKTRSLEALGRK